MTSRLLACAVLLLAFCLTACESMGGTMTEKNDDTVYSLEFASLTAERTHDFALERGDALWVEIAHRSGDIRLSIRGENGEEAYTGNRLSACSFSVSVPQAGSYRVTVVTEKAEGSIRIERISKAEEQQ